MACPFFMPIEKLEDGAWPHPARLPLGCGWRGQCAAPGHEGEVPSQEELHEFCNLGYAQGCSRLPRERAWDAVRFAVAAPGAGSGKGTPASRIQVRYVCEREHRPVEHGTLEFDASELQCSPGHADRRVQRMAEYFLAEYLNRRKRRDAARMAS